MTAVWCSLCRRDHILPTCAECGCDLAHGHIILRVCEPCKIVLRLERLKQAEQQRNSTKGEHTHGN
jgi:hypothetical protein